MKILFISSRFYPFTGGVENVVLNLAKEFKTNRHEVLVIASRMGIAKKGEEVVEGIEVRRVWMNLPRSVLGYLAFPLRFGIGLIGLIRLIRKFGPDVINYHFPDDSSVYVWLAYLLLKKPSQEKPVPMNRDGLGNAAAGELASPANLTLNIHGNDLQVFGKRPWYRFFLRKLINKARTVIVNSTYIEKDLQENFPAAKGKTKIIPNAVDERFFGINETVNVEKITAAGKTRPDKSGRLGNLPHRQAGATAAKLANRVPYILHLGRLVPKKGVDVLIEAYARAKDELESNLVIVGDGKRQNELENLVHEKNLEDKVIFVGFKSGNELLQYISNARFAVVPSRREPFGIVALELAAAGKAIIASKTGGLAEILEDEKTALLFENESAEELAEKIIRLENNAKLRENIAKNAKKMAKEYSWGTVANSYIKTYKTGTKA